MKPEPLLKIEAPYLLFLGNVPSKIYAKTAEGLVQWSPEKCLGQINSKGGVTKIGLPEMTLMEAAKAGAKTLVVGVASEGGILEEDWIKIFCDAMACGLHVAAGLHVRLRDIPELRDAALKYDRQLIDARVPPPHLTVGTGRKRQGLRLLTIGTDCAVGKKWAALSLARAMQARGMDVTFRATGQTGIMIAGQGIPIDAVVSDFVSGAAEILSPDNVANHWDIVEGQGSLFHPGYAAVTLGLLHGTQPDAFIVCHEAGREEMLGFPGYPLPSIAHCIERTLIIGRLTNPKMKCLGVAINTSALGAVERTRYLAKLERETSLPCIDPVVEGVDLIITRLTHEFG